MQPKTEYIVIATGTGDYKGSRPSTLSIAVLKEKDGFVLVEGGTFTMGSPITETEPTNGRDRGDDEVQHDVTVSSFYMAEYEVTQSQYESVIGSNPSEFPRDGSDAPNRPVEKVSWFDAVVFCNTLSEQEGLQEVYTIYWNSFKKNYIVGAAMDRTKNGYRLPTEAEWEYAARGGNKSKGYLYSGSNTADEVASWWTQTLSDGTVVSNETYDVGTKVPNELGLHDMSGNVSEFCWDWYGDYDLGTGAKTDPMGPSTGTYRVIRGGNWMSVINSLSFRVAWRGRAASLDEGLSLNGIRLVLSAF